MVEEYFSADRILELKIGSVVQVSREDDDLHFPVNLVGADYEKTIITSLPNKQNLPAGETYESLYKLGTMLEMKTIHDGRVVAFESSALGIHGDRLLISSFPEMIETRRLRRDIRFPCALPVDIRSGNSVSYGVITDISNGGCQINVPKDSEYTFIEESINQKKALDLEIFFPIAEQPIIISAHTKSSLCQIDGACKVGLAFDGEYECVRRYLESLQLDSVAPFFY